MENEKDYYKILGVSRDASDEEMKAAYRKLCKKYHPDLHPGDEEAAKKQREVNIAYKTLKNKDKRKKYDRMIAEEEATRQQKEKSATWDYGQHGPGFDNQTFMGKSTGTGKYSGKVYEEEPEEEQNKFWSEVKQAWQEIKEEEQSEETFAERHATLDRGIARKDKKSRTKKCYYYDEKGHKVYGTKTRKRTTPEEVMFQLKRGSLHVAYETLIQLNKLTHITDDSVVKYVIRNRRLAGTVLAACIAVGAVGAANSNVEQPSQPSYSTSSRTESEDVDLPDEIIIGATDTTETVAKEQDYTVYRTYTIKYGDTLSELAEDASCSVEDIQYYNGIWNPSYIKAGDDIVIPYTIESDELEYSTATAYVSKDMTLEQLAAKYSTTEGSIITLNEEAIGESGEILSDTLLVPTFATQEEIKSAKAEAESYTYGK